VCICEGEGERGRGRDRERDNNGQPITVFPTDQIIIDGPEPVKLQRLLIVLCNICHLIVALVTNNVVNEVQLA
jgi:hypothetical protein